MSEPIDEIDAAETARLQAEARRKRILEKADTRMGVVSGEQTLAVEEKAASEEKAARIRAARNRRYKKKTITAATATDETEDQRAPFDEPQATDASCGETEATTADITEDDEPKMTTETVAKGDDNPSISIDVPKKKYLGVARMRRNMIKKRQQEGQHNGGVKSEDAAEIQETPIDLKSAPKYPLKLSTVQIYMHILTVLLLFFAGMDVSLQQHQTPLVLDSNLAFVQHGIPIIHRELGPIPAVVTKLGIFDQNQSPFHQMDEFKAEETESLIIDPVFGVDLDALTKGPGIIKLLARGAVSTHRSLLWFVYHLPLSILKSLMGVPQALARSPPSLCMIALVVRHVIGRGVLGAGLPENTAVVDKGIDVIAMAKNFLSNMLSNGFPTLVVLYDAFAHLRVDMYVVLCGVFSGLVSIHFAALSKGRDSIVGPADVLQEESEGAVLNNEL